MNKLPVLQKAKFVSQLSNLSALLVGLPILVVLLLAGIWVLPGNSVAWAEQGRKVEDNQLDPLRNTGWPVPKEPLQTSCVQRAATFKVAPALPDSKVKQEFARIDDLVANLDPADLKRGPISNGTINLFARIDNSGKIQGQWFYRAPRQSDNNHLERQTNNSTANSRPTYQPYGSQNLVIEVPDSALVALSVRGRQQAALPSTENAVSSRSFAAFTAWSLGFHYGADAVTRANTYGNQTINSQIRAGFAGLASQAAPDENQIPRLVFDVVDQAFPAQNNSSSKDDKSVTSPYLLVFSKVKGPDSMQVGQWQNYQWHRDWDSRYGDRSYVPLQNRDYQPDWLFSAPGLYKLQNTWLVPNAKAAQLGRQAVNFSGNIYFVVGDTMIAHLRQAYLARQTAENHTLPLGTRAYPQIGSGRWCVEYPQGAQLSIYELNSLFLQCQNSGFCSFSTEFLKSYLPGFGTKNPGSSPNGNADGNTNNGNSANSGGVGSTGSAGNIGNGTGIRNDYQGALPIQPLPPAQGVPGVPLNPVNIVPPTSSAVLPATGNLGNKFLVNNPNSPLAPLIKPFTPLGPLVTNPFADGTGTQVGGSSLSEAQLKKAIETGLSGSNVMGKLGVNGTSSPAQQGQSSATGNDAPGTSESPNPSASAITSGIQENGGEKEPAENSGNLNAAGERVLSEVDYQPASFFTEDRLAGMIIGFGSALLLVGVVILGAAIYRLQVARKTK